MDVYDVEFWTLLKVPATIAPVMMESRTNARHVGNSAEATSGRAANDPLVFTITYPTTRAFSLLRVPTSHSSPLA